MYTITGYDASAHVSEETQEAEQAAAKGVWQSVASSALIGWFVLLAITFAATDVDAVNDGFGTSIVGLHLRRDEPELGRGDHPDRRASASSSAAWHASRAARGRSSPSRATAPFRAGRLWSRVSAKGVPVNAVLGSSRVAFLITLPALPGKGTFVPPVAFFAVTSIGTIGLYIAYVAPVYLRWRAGDSFEPGSWTLGARYRWMNPIAVGFVIVMLVVLCLPFYSTAVPWEDDFDWNAFNYTPLVVGRRSARAHGSPGSSVRTSATRARSGRSSSTRAWASREDRRAGSAAAARKLTGATRPA